MPATADTRLGRVVAQRFKCSDLIGSAGSSTVHRMMDMVTRDDFSIIKLLDVQQPTETVQAWFEHIAQELRALNHPHIAPWRHTGWCPRVHAFYLVRPRMSRPLLNSPCGNLESTMRELGSALVYLHEHNVVHGNIAPSNLFRDQQGHACLADMGMVRLRAGLGIRMASLSDGQRSFLAPEQQEDTKSPCTAAADVYALGCVFVRLADGDPSRLENYDASQVCAELDMPWQDTVVSMLDKDPKRRIRNAKMAETFEESSKGLPRHSLVLSKKARSAIKALYTRDENAEWNSRHDDFEELSERVRQDLGEDTGYQVRLYTKPGNEGDTMVCLLGHSHEYYCKPEDNYLRAVNFHPEASSEKSNEQLRLYPSVWAPEQRASSSTDSALETMLQSLNVNMEASEADSEDIWERYEEWYPEIGQQAAPTTDHVTVKQFAHKWLQALERRENQIRRSGLAYSDFSYFPQNKQLRFTLTDPLPKDLTWEDEVEIMTCSQEYRRHEVQLAGKLVAVEGHYIAVKPADEKGIAVLPASGRLVPNPDADLSSLARQREAVEKLQANKMQNPQLGKIISGEQESQSTESGNLEFCQSWLSDDKKQAVQRSLAALQLFLIQGPPGTGKTTVIAEIVLQILRQDPDARILVTSQSNVAVDNALSRIEEAASEAGWQVPVMIRYLSATAEQKGTGSKEYTLREQAEVWRNRTRRNCGDVIQSMRQAESQGHSEAILVNALTPNGSVALETQEWLQKAQCIMQQVQAYQDSCEIARKRAVEQASSASIQAYAWMQAMLAEIREEARDWLQMLPTYLALDPHPELHDTSQILCRLVNLAEEDTEALTARVRDWQQIVGRRQILEKWGRAVGARDFLSFIARHARVVGTTCNHSGSSGIQPRQFSWVIVDEAGRATLPETLIPIVRGARCIMVGDIRQLPPTIEDDLIEERHERKELEVSLFEHLEKRVTANNLNDETPISSLQTQYRMHPAIGGMISQVFYEGGLRPGKRAKEFKEEYPYLYTDMPHAVRWLDTSSQPDAREKQKGRSYRNNAEVQKIQLLLQSLNDRILEDGDLLHVGVISGYLAQVKLLRTRLNPQKRGWPRLEVEIATVDAFQGRECDVILYSVVRSNPQGNIGFLRNERRLNVALSRARALLIIVGDAKMRGRANPFTEVLKYMEMHPEDCRIMPATVGA